MSGKLAWISAVSSSAVTWPPERRRELMIARRDVVTRPPRSRNMPRISSSRSALATGDVTLGAYRRQLRNARTCTYRDLDLSKSAGCVSDHDEAHSGVLDATVLGAFREPSGPGGRAAAERGRATEDGRLVRRAPAKLGSRISARQGRRRSRSRSRLSGQGRRPPARPRIGPDTFGVPRGQSLSGPAGYRIS